MEPTQGQQFFKRLRDELLNTIHPVPIIKPIMAIGKPAVRQKGDPDFIINSTLDIDEEKYWTINVYPDELTIRYGYYTNRNGVEGDIDSLKQLYDLISSGGCQTTAMLYMRLLDSWHPTYSVKDFKYASASMMVKYMVHMILWEPEKIKWVDFLPLDKK
jgi:hypothetical protein